MALHLDSPGFRDALLILGAAGLVIPAFHRIRITPVIGFILTGFIIGPAGLGSLSDRWPWLSYASINDPHTIEPFAEIGIILLLFSIGLELSFKRLWGMRKLVFGLGASELTISGLLLGVAMHLLAGLEWTAAIGLGLALALSSTALVLPMTGTTGAVGRPAFAMLLMEDVALVPIVFALGALSPHTADQGWAPLFQTMWLGALAVAIILIAGRWFVPRLFAQASRTKSPELFLSASLLIVIGASIATTAAGLSPIVGALAAGLVVAETEYHAEVQVVTAPFQGLALGVFLITVGMSLDARFILANWQMLIAGMVGVILLKSIVTALLLRIMGAARGTAAYAGLLMASPSETTLIVLAASQAANLLSAEAATFWTTVTALGLTATPLLARAGKDIARRVERLSGEDADQVTPEQTAARAVIVGFGRVGRLVAQMLDEHDKPYVAVEADIDNVRRARGEGYSILFGDVARNEFLDRLDLGSATALILTMDDPVQLVHITKRVREEHPKLCIVARARDTGHAAELYRAGATDAVPETVESSLQLSEAVLVDLGVAMGPVIASIHEKRAELRQEIMTLGETDREPPVRGRRLNTVA